MIDGNPFSGFDGYGYNMVGESFLFSFDRVVTVQAMRYRTDWWTKAPKDFEIFAGLTPETTESVLVDVGGKPPQLSYDVVVDQLFPFSSPVTAQYFNYTIDSMYSGGHLVMVEVSFCG